MNTGFEIATASHIGKHRPHNEDSVLTDKALALVVMADGMGGYKAGEVASAIAVTTIHLAIQTARLGKTKKRVDGHVPGLIRRAINQANSNIYAMARSNPECYGMGTTVICSLLSGQKLFIGNVGDSRLYRYRDNDLEQITRDHTLIQEMIDRGMYTPEEANAKMPKNLVTRALGLENNVEVDIVEETIVTGDIYLLCTDGLNDMVNDEEIHLTLSKYSANLAQAADKLVQLANHYGGKDNISVALVRI
ncbi:MAG TPA: Stp1/IreP family PP2C-type Ser/Thr phosphatase [Gammaproteobacteria bacterium]